VWGVVIRLLPSYMIYMTKVYLLREYRNHSSNTIIDVENNELNGLILSGTARLASTRDFLVKPLSTIQNVFSKAFNSAPKTK
jgi:hypothetical protein